MPKRILVTGGAGFIGSAFVRWVIKNQPSVEVVNFDKLTYAGNLENLREIEDNPRYRFMRGDIGNRHQVREALSGVDAVVNYAAETHNDRSVLDPGSFVRTNLVGTHALLEEVRAAGIERFHHISTDEVYGDLGLNEDRSFMEGDAYKPRSPYSSTKAGSDHLVQAYFHTFGLPMTISNCVNNFGPYQFPEKLIPLFSTNALEGKQLPLFKSSLNRREYIHADDHSSAVWAILERGKIGETYNIGTGVEKTVEEVTGLILSTLGKSESLKTYVPDRPGHDRRYALNSTKIREELGWSPTVDFDEGMRETILWYRDNEDWWRRVKSGDYQKYYEEYYDKTLTKAA